VFTFLWFRFFINIAHLIPELKSAARLCRLIDSRAQAAARLCRLM